MVQARLKPALLSIAYTFALGLAMIPDPVPAAPPAVANDRDWNHVNDFWPRLQELYAMTSVTDPAPPSDIQLMELDR